MSKYGKPKIFDTDQGSQFTSTDFTSVLIEAGIQMSMDGKGLRATTSLLSGFGEWSEEVYLHSYESVPDARASMRQYIAFYNRKRPHSSLDNQTPEEVYFGTRMVALAA